MAYIDPADRPYGPGNPDYQYDGREDEQQPSLFRPLAHEIVADRLAREAHSASAHAFRQVRVEIDEAFRKVLIRHNRSVAQRKRFLRIRGVAI